MCAKRKPTARPLGLFNCGVGDFVTLWAAQPVIRSRSAACRWSQLSLGWSELTTPLGHFLGTSLGRFSKIGFELRLCWCAILGLNQSVHILRGSGRFLSRERLCGINSALPLTRGHTPTSLRVFAITLLTACSSLKPNGPGLCTVPRRVRGEKTERQEDIPPKRPSSFRRYLGARSARPVPSAVGDSVHGCSDTAPREVETAQRRQPGPRLPRAVGQADTQP